MPAANSSSAHPLVGTSIGSYRVIRELARGGMGVVFEAIHISLDQRAAVKVLSNDLLQDPNYQDYYARFFNEARAITIIKHPGIVKIYDHGQLPDGTAFILMEFLEGESLERRITEASQGKGCWLPLVMALRIARQLASALTEAHRKSILHRDLKPANVMLVPDSEAAGGERTKLLDFGIARFLDSPYHRTAAGTIMGTPPYMSPEQCMGNQVDAKTDVYALGIIMYEMLSGQRPFNGTVTAIMVQHVGESPPELCSVAAAVPAPVSALIHKMLAKNQKHRPTMGHVVEEIQRLERALINGALSTEDHTAGPSDPTRFLPIRRNSEEIATRIVAAGPSIAPSPSRIRIWALLFLVLGVFLVIGGIVWKGRH